MTEIAYFDPADLMVWFDQNVLFWRFDPRNKSLVRSEAIEAAFGIIRGAFDIGAAGLKDEVLHILDQFGPPAMMSLLTLWHEQRHFFDHVLTNFGASRVRLHWMIRAQLENIYRVAAADGVLGLPIDVYGDPVECDALGVNPKAVTLLGGIGNFLANRRQMLAQDREDGRTPVSELPVDGFCQLEALGSLAQIAGMTVLLRKYLYHFDRFEAPFSRFPYLESIFSVMRIYGLEVIESFQHGDPSITAINPYLVGPILLAALMCRRTGLSGDDINTSCMPARRLILILSQLEREGVKAASSAEDGFAVVNRACRRLWGRSVVDDLDEDIAFQETQIEKSRQASSPEDVEFIEQYNSARKELRKILTEDPRQFCDPWLYVTKTMPTVRPKIVLADRSGQTVLFGGGEDDNFRVLFAEGTRWQDSPRVCYYLDLKKTVEGVVAGVRFADRHWVNGFNKSRHIRLLTEGRRQAQGSELDAFLAQRELRRSPAGDRHIRPIELRFRPGHEYPEPDRSADLIFEMFGAKKLTCEISGREITPDSAMLVNPWDFERYPALREVLAQYNKLGICPTDGSFEDDSIGNWNWWLVHRDYSRYLGEV